jgi:hypothetical protein
MVDMRVRTEMVVRKQYELRGDEKVRGGVA